MTQGCIWLGSGRRTGPVDGSTLWSRKSGSLLAVVLGGAGGTGVGKGKNLLSCGGGCLLAVAGG